MASTSSLLTATQRYAAGALFAVALRRAHAHQTRPFDVGRADEAEEEEDDDDASLFWTHHSNGLLRPVFRCTSNGFKDFVVFVVGWSDWGGIDWKWDFFFCLVEM